MSGTQENITPERAITRAVAESSYGGGGTGTRVWNQLSDTEPECNRTTLEIADVRQHEYDNPTPQLGQSDWKWDPSFLIRAVSTKLNSGASPATPPNLIPLKALMGGAIENAGSTVAASPSPTASGFTVASGHGSRFQVNQLINVVISGQVYCSAIKSISTDAITLAWDLPSAPASSAVVYNMYNYCLDTANIKSLYLEHLKTDSANLQWQLYGGTGEISITTEYDKLVMYKASLTGPKWEEGALSLGTTYEADTQGAPFNFAQGDCYILDPASSTATKSTVTKITFKPKTGNAHLPEVTSTGTGGKSGIFRGDLRSAGDIEVQMPYDPALRSTWSGLTQVRLAFVVSVGSGTSKQFFGIHVPLCVIVGKPKIIRDGNGNPLYHTATFRMQIDASGSDKYARAPLMIGIG